MATLCMGKPGACRSAENARGAQGATTAPSLSPARCPPPAEVRGNREAVSQSRARQEGNEAGRGWGIHIQKRNTPFPSHRVGAR